MKRILVATDFSDVAREAYYAAAALGRAHGASVEIAHEVEALPPVYDDHFSESLQMERYYARLETSVKTEAEHAAFENLDVVPHLLYKDAKHGNIVDFARDECFDVVVVSTHGRTGLAHVLLGSFAENVVRHSTVPVLTYRRKETDEGRFEPKSILVPLDFSENSKAALPLVRQIRSVAEGDLKFIHVFPEVSVRGDWGDVQERLRVSSERIFSGMTRNTAAAPLCWQK